MFPCYYAALSTCYEDNCIAYHSYVIERQWFLGWPYPVSAFGVFYHVCLQQAVCGMPPCTSRPFCAEWHACWRIVSPSLTSPFPTRVTRILWTLESQITQHPLYIQCSSVNIWPSLACARMKICNCSDGQGFFWRGTFSLENIRKQGVVGRITWEFTMTCEPKTHCTWEITRKVNLRSVAKRIFWKKTMNLGAVGRITYKFTITLNPRRILFKKTQGIWGVWYSAHFPWKIRNPGAVGRNFGVKHTEFGRRRSRVKWIYDQYQRQTHYIRKQAPGGLPCCHTALCTCQTQTHCISREVFGPALCFSVWWQVVCHLWHPNLLAEWHAFWRVVNGPA